MAEYHHFFADVCIATMHAVSAQNQCSIAVNAQSKEGELKVGGGAWGGGGQQGAAPLIVDQLFALHITLSS